MNQIIRFGKALCLLITLGFAFPKAASAQALISNFSDVTFWVGSGANQAVLVVDWNDGTSPVSLAWGFRWDGVATGQDMLLAIASSTIDSGTGNILATGASTGLTVYTTTYSFGDAVDRIVLGTSHDQGGFGSTGYWEYLCSGGTFSTPPSGDDNTFAGSSYYPGTNSTPDWISSWSGFSDRTLSDGSWDAWSYAVGGVSQAVDQPIAAVPEPGVVSLLFAGGLILVWRFRRHATARVLAR